MNRTTTAAWRGLAAGVLFLVVTFGVAVCMVTTLGGGTASDPRAAFEAHLLALDEGRLVGANALVDIACGRVTKADAEAAKAGLESAGLTFQTAFPVEEVWLNESGTEAILELAPPPGGLPLPGVQGMMLVEGEWLLSCGR